MRQTNLIERKLNSTLHPKECVPNTVNRYLHFFKEILKIGVIYVQEGQDDQKEILKNEGGSALYREFVNSLGWPVDIKTHRGYMGGLDRKLTTGQVAPYYATSTSEAIFHDITLMPTNLQDPQQIHKVNLELALASQLIINRKNMWVMILCT